MNTIKYNISDKIINYFKEKSNGELITREELLMSIYGRVYDMKSQMNSVYVYMTKEVKQKLQEDGYMVLTIYREGFKVIKFK